MGAGNTIACSRRGLTDVFDYIETFYNRSRRHSALLGKTPASAFEAWVLKQQGKMAA
jgi:transposase InsO family protein